MNTVANRGKGASGDGAPSPATHPATRRRAAARAARRRRNSIFFFVGAVGILLLLFIPLHRIWTNNFDSSDVAVDSTAFTFLETLAQAHRTFKRTHKLNDADRLLQHMSITGSHVDQTIASIKSGEEKLKASRKEWNLLQSCAVTMYDVLSSILLRSSAVSVPPQFKVPANILGLSADEGDAKLLFNWAATYLYTANQVLPDLFVHKVLPQNGSQEKKLTVSHTTALAMSVNVLTWVRQAVVPMLGEDEGNFCSVLEARRGKSVMQFCEHTLASSSFIERRIAANYEELIVLHPQFGPFRQHYLMSFLRLSRYPSINVTSSSAVQLLRNDLEKVDNYQHKDSAHIALDQWMMMLLSPEPLEDIAKEVLVSFGSCSAAMWPSNGVWTNMNLATLVPRPPMVSAEEIRETVQTYDGVLPPRILDRLRDC